MTHKLTSLRLSSGINKKTSLSLHLAFNARFPADPENGVYGHIGRLLLQAAGSSRLNGLTFFISIKFDSVDDHVMKKYRTSGYKRKSQIIHQVCEIFFNFNP
jgi:hypothetical protein